MIPDVLKIAVLHLAQRPEGVQVKWDPKSLYEALVRERLLIGELSHHVPGQDAVYLYKPTRKGLKMVEQYDKTKVKAA